MVVVSRTAAEVGQRRMGLYAVDTLWNGCAGAAEKLIWSGLDGDGGHVINVTVQLHITEYKKRVENVRGP